MGKELGEGRRSGGNSMCKGREWGEGGSRVSGGQ